MILTYISRFQFKICSDGIYSLPAYGDGFWQKYLDVFSKIFVVGEQVKNYLDDGSMVKITDKRISIIIIPSIEHPKEIASNYNYVKKKLVKILHDSEAVLVKPASNKGILAVKYCENKNIPYMVEMTGDVQSALMVRKNILMKIYSNILYNRTIRAIKNCKFGLYVTEHYLQRKYPIKGLACGCTDAIIPYTSKEILLQREALIKSLDKRKEYNIGLIGYYHDNRKGIDAAIRALELCDNTKYKYKLKILGVGTDQDQIKWIKFARKFNVESDLEFLKPLPGSEAVAKWIDTIDLIILPSRSEGFPRAIAEAMSRACPVITSNVCGLSELADEKWQHKITDYSSLAKLILKISNNPNLMYEAARFNYYKALNYSQELLKDRRNKFLKQFYQYAEINKNLMV